MEDNTQNREKNKNCLQRMGGGRKVYPSENHLRCVCLYRPMGESATAAAAAAADRQLLGSHPIGIQRPDQRRGLPITPEAEGKIGNLLFTNKM